MSINWTEDLATNVFQIDMQHKQLFNTINDLLEACKKGQAKSEMLKVIDFLEKYVNEHFASEESYMEKYSYPHLAAHKREHANFIKDFNKFKREFNTEGITLSMIVSLTHTLVQWLTNHIRKTDKLMASFLKEQKNF